MSPLALSLQFLQAQPDRRLVDLARDGHEPAFEALVRRYRKELLAYCRRLQPSSTTAEDALQQALLQAWKALKAGAEVRDVRPWLYRIAHNVTLNQLRARAAVPGEVAEAAGGQEVHQLVEQRLRARAALAEMASLPALQRDVFVSTTLDGASHEEVASALGLSSGAVRGLIYRARATLRAAAAAFTPGPAMNWAMRRVESQSGGARAMTEALASGGGAGVAAVLLKGGAVLTLAGAVAGAGAAIFTQASSHRPAEVRVAGQAHLGVGRDARGSAVLLARARGAGAERSPNGKGEGQPASGPLRQRGRGLGRLGDDHHGGGTGSSAEHGGRSPSGSDGGQSTSSIGSSDGGSAGGAPTAGSSGGSDGSGSSGSGGGPDGGSGGSSGSSTSPTSGSDGGSSGGGPGPSGDQLMTALATSDGGSGFDGGTSGSGSSSGSGDTTTTSSH